MHLFFFNLRLGVAQHRAGADFLFRARPAQHQHIQLHTGAAPAFQGQGVCAVIGQRGKGQAVTLRQFCRYAVDGKGSSTRGHCAIAQQQGSARRSERRQCVYHFVPGSAAKRLQPQEIHMVILAPVAQTVGVVKVAVGKLALVHTVRVLIIPGTGLCIGVLRIIVGIHQCGIPRQLQGTVLRRRELQCAENIQNTVLRQVRIVHKAAAHQVGLLIQPGVRHIGINLVLPHQLIAIGIKAKVLVTAPQMVAGRHSHIGHRGSGIPQGGVHYKIIAGTFCRPIVHNAGQSHILLGIRSPKGHTDLSFFHTQFSVF